MIPYLHLLTKIQIVLVAPEYPGNVGSVARAMKTMGFSRLAIVAPKRYLFLEPQAVWMASSASEILYQTRVFNSLEEAVANSQWIVGTSVRPRSIGEPLLSVREAAPEVLMKIETERVDELSIVFGSEPTGLLNQHLILCQQTWTIPTSNAYTSLNLAQAVQVILYEVRQAMLARNKGEHDKAQGVPLASSLETEGFFKHLEQSLIESQYLDPNNPRYLMEHLRALFNRTSLTRSEIDMLRGMLVAWQKSYKLSNQ